MGVDPLTLLAIGTITAAAGSGYAAYSSYQQGKAEKKRLDAQAAMEQEAAQAEAGNIREQGKRLLASQRAGLAGSGVKIDSPTGDALQQETRRLTEQDALSVLKGGANRASLLRMEGKSARRAGTAGAISGGLQAAGIAARGTSRYKLLKTKTDT